MLSPRSHFGKRVGTFPAARLAARENPSGPADMAYESFEDFRELLVEHYYNPDGSLFKDESRLVEIFDAFGGRMGPLMMREVLSKSTFVHPGSIIKSKAVQLAALRADKKTAFRFCPIAHRNIATVIEVLTAKFDNFRFMTSLDNPTIALEVAQAFPYKTPWWLSISVSSHLPTSTHKVIDVSRFDHNALGTLVCTWLSAPDRVYKYRIGMAAPPEFESVSCQIVRNALAILYVRNTDFGVPVHAEHQISELLGVRYRKAIEIRSWANKLHVLSTGVDAAMPLYDKSIPYTVQAAKHAFEIGSVNLDLYGKRLHPYHRHRTYGHLKRRGDTMLARIAQREDLCLIVLPIIVRFILDPTPPRFRPCGKRV